MTSLQDKRQSVVTQSDVLGHPLLISVIEQIIAQQEECQQQHNADGRPYPVRHARLCALRIEPLVLNGL